MKKKIIIGIVLVLVGFFLGDLISIYTFKRPLIYLKKSGNIYYGLLYDTYSCPEYKRPQIKRKGLLEDCSLTNYDLGKESSYEIVSPTDIKISLKDTSSWGTTMIIKDDSSNGHVYGEDYIIERESDGKWYEVKPIIDNYGFNDIGLLLDDNNEVTFKIDWTSIYGLLPYGNHYRLLKRYENNTYLAAYFELEE